MLGVSVSTVELIRCKLGIYLPLAPESVNLCEHSKMAKKRVRVVSQQIYGRLEPNTCDAYLGRRRSGRRGKLQRDRTGRKWRTSFISDSDT